MSGHVFAVRGDVRRLRCDARMVAVYEANEPNARWFAEDESGLRLTKPQDSWSQTDVRVRPLGATDKGPALWAAKVGFDGTIGLDAAMKSVAQYLEKASASLDRSRLVSGRCKPLLVLHAVATGRYNSAHRKDSAIVQLLGRVHAAVESHDVDVAIVANEPEVYAALQSARGTGISPTLDPALHGLAHELAGMARWGDLSALVGAGLSMNAGLPNWGELLARVPAAQMVGPLRVGENLLDYATRIEAVDGRPSFVAAIAQQCRANRYALGHAILGSMPIREFVTLNYDQLLEAAARDAGAPLTVIPHSSITSRDRRLLKLHGCVARTEDIVITRRDYDAFDGWRAAFKGVVEAQLITRHMLFIGFGMADPNVEEVLKTVSNAVQRDEGKMGKAVGTVLTFELPVSAKDAPALPLRYVRVGADQATTGERARQLEILLDEVARLAEHGTDHLLDQRFEQLQPGDITVREKVADFLGSLHSTHPDSRLRREIMERLRPLMGGDPKLTRLFDPATAETSDGPLHPGR